MAGPVFTPELIARYAQQIPADPQPAPQSVPQSHKHALMHKLGLPVLLGGQGADLVTTLTAPGTEANPILGQNPVRQALIKGGGAAGLAVLLDKLSDKSPKAALIAALLSGGAGAAAAIHNARMPK